MGFSSSDRVRTRAQRVASRVAYDSFTERTARLIYADDGLLKIGFFLLASALICTICGMWNPPNKYRKYMTPDRTIVCNTSFTMKSPILTAADRERARLLTPQYYRNNPAIFDEYEGRFLSSLQLILERPDFTSCTTEDLLFLQECLPANFREDSIMQAFEKFHAYFADDVDLADFRQTLKEVLDLYRKKGLLRRLEKDDSASNDDKARLAGGGLVVTKIRVFEDPNLIDAAHEEDVADVLLGSGSNIKKVLKERISNLEVATLIGNRIKNTIPETLRYEPNETDKMRERAERNVEPTVRSFQEGDTLVAANKMIGGEELAILNAERANQLKSRSFAAKTGRFLASFVLLSIFLIAVFLLFHNYRIMPHSGVHKRNVVEVVVFLAMFVVFIAIGHIIQERLDNGAASPEMVPILMLIQLTALASTWEIAISFGMIAAFIMTLSGPCTIDTFVTFAGSGVAVALASKNVRSRTQLFGVAFATAVTAFVLSLVSGYVVNDHSRVLQEAGERGLWGFLAGFLTAGVLPIFERCCGILTPMRLLEYSNPSHPLLQELNRRAPATYSHSIQTAALAEPAAEAIGARSALVRVGAYFHDVGKMLQPENFTENQHGYNIHDNLEPRMSALVIVAHTKDGVDLGKRYNLPSQIIDLIEQHHGTMLVGFFYNNACKNARANDPNAPAPDEAPFRYPGPIPQSKEAGILMLSDAVESASRSLADWTPRKVEALVHGIIEKRIEDGQFNDSGLTLGELHTVEQSLVSTMLASHHKRIQYPDAKKKESAEDVSKESVKDAPKEAAKDETYSKSRNSDGSTIVRLTPKRKENGESSTITKSDVSSFTRRSGGGFEDATQK